MTGYEAFILHHAINLHFNGSYDCWKYNFKTNITEKTYWKRPDKFQLTKIGKRFKNKDGDEGEVAFDTAIEYGTHPPAGYGQFQHPAYKQAIKMKPTKEPDKPEDGKLGTKQEPTADKKPTSSDPNILQQQSNIAQKLTKK